jgi:outer membrane protein OmpA-like peptidoglycan-associated protein
MAAAAEASVSATAAPLGAGVLADTQNNKPMLKVYFDVSRAQVAPEFAKVAVDLLAYAKDHPDAKLLISGFNDPSGNAVQNAKLAKERAEAVRAALKAQGLALGRMALVKPVDGAAAVAAGANNAELRRVEVHVQ